MGSKPGGSVSTLPVHVARLEPLVDSNVRVSFVNERRIAEDTPPLSNTRINPRQIALLVRMGFNWVEGVAHFEQLAVRKLEHFEPVQWVKDCVRPLRMNYGDLITGTNGCLCACAMHSQWSKCRGTRLSHRPSKANCIRTHNEAKAANKGQTHEEGQAETAQSTQATI